MTTLLTILHVIMCGFLMLTVLLQSGKGGGMGGAFGGGNAATVFGGSGASSFLKRLTAGAAIVFMCTSMLLAYISSHAGSDALEKWGEQQAELAKKKEDARQSALGAGSGSAGSGSAGSLMFKVPAAGSGSAGSGSAGAIQLSPEDQQKLQDEMAKQLGAQPAPVPAPAGSGSATPAPAPAPAGSGSAK